MQRLRKLYARQEWHLPQVQYVRCNDGMFLRAQPEGKEKTLCKLSTFMNCNLTPKANGS